MDTRGESRIRVVVVGTGFGCRVHVPALRAAGFEVVGLVGTRPDRLARKAAEVQVDAVYTDLNEAISRTDAKLVTVATTPATHGALVKTAISRGCHVLCEKPFAFDSAEAESLLEAARHAGIIHMVAHEFRWLPERALFGRAIREGLIGVPRFLAIDQFNPFCADPETRLPKWWFDESSGGGWLGASGSHIIDQVREWFGDFASLSANLLVVSQRANAADDSYSTRFLLKNGMEGSMQQTAGAWGPPAVLWRCAGTKGTVWIENGKVLLADKSGTREPAVPEELRLPTPPQPADLKAADRLSHFEIGPFTRLCEVLRAAIEGKPSTTVAAPTFVDGLATMKVMDAIRASAAQRGALVGID
jgi:predicted dehydrogenase